MWKIGPGGKALLVLLGLAILGFTADRYLGRDWILQRLGLAPQSTVSLGASDFPPGAAAPVGDLVAVPTRSLKVLSPVRGSTAALLHAAGGKGLNKSSPASRGYGVEFELQLVARESEIAEALATGGDRGGADAAVLSVDRYAQLRGQLPDAHLKAVMLLSHSRGEEAIAAGAGLDQIAGLKGSKIALCPESPSRYLLLWSLAHHKLPLDQIEVVPAASSADAARLLREARVEAAAGSRFDLEGPARERAGQVIASTADAPHLISTVLVVRSGVLARWPDAVRRLVRAVLDSSEAIGRDPHEGARLLATHASTIGEPYDALKFDPPAGLDENLAFFGLRGDSPVRYDESFTSAASLWLKLGEVGDASAPSDTRELGPLQAASTATPPAPARPALPPRASPPPQDAGVATGGDAGSGA